MQQQKWEKISAEKRRALAEQIPLEHRIPPHLLPPDEQLDVTPFPRESGWFSKRELEITDSTASHILKKIASRTWSSEEVTRAFSKRAAAAQQLVQPRSFCMGVANFMRRLIASPKSSLAKQSPTRNRSMNTYAR